MNSRIAFAMITAACAGILGSATFASALSVTQTTNGTVLGTALGGGGLTIDNVIITNGAVSQFGTYTGFTSPPVTIGNGVVLSTGQAVETTAAFHSSGSTPDTDTLTGGTAAFDAYGPGHIANFSSSNDVAALTVDFTLGAVTPVGFNFVFGSVEYPVFTSSFTDAFVAFLDGTAVGNQIVFDAANNAVQVGNTFAGALTTLDTNTAFSDPHGLVQLQTFTLSPLAVGAHTISFQIGDVNDHALDSAVFISNFHAGTGAGGTNPGGGGTSVPEPASLALLALGLLVVVGGRWYKGAI